MSTYELCTEGTSNIFQTNLDFFTFSIESLLLTATQQVLLSVHKYRPKSSDFGHGRMRDDVSRPMARPRNTTILECIASAVSPLHSKDGTIAYD